MEENFAKQGLENFEFRGTNFCEYTRKFSKKKELIHFKIEYIFLYFQFALDWLDFCNTFKINLNVQSFIHHLKYLFANGEFNLFSRIRRNFLPQKGTFFVRCWWFRGSVSYKRFSRNLVVFEQILQYFLAVRNLLRFHNDVLHFGFCFSYLQCMCITFRPPLLLGEQLYRSTQL